MNVIEWLTTPFAYPFMVRGMIVALMVGVVAAIVGTFVVLRGMAFFGDALAHTILPGIAVGYLVHGGLTDGLFWWALGSAVVAALGIGAITESGEIREDTAIGVVFAGMFALGIALISLSGNYAVDLAHILFGNVLGVSMRQVVMVGLFGGGVLIVMFAFFKEFVLLSFDPVLAETLRLPTRWLHYLLLLLIAITVVVAIEAVGVALLLAMLITPPATATLLTYRLPRVIGVAAAIGAFSAVAGLYLSFYFNMASGAAIVLVATACFVLAFLLAPARGWLARRHRTPLLSR